MTFRRIATQGFAGGARRAVYELSDPIRYRGGSTCYVCADFAYTPDRGPETMVFACNAEGKVLDWTDLWAWPGDAVTDDMAVELWLEERGGDGR